MKDIELKLKECKSFSEAGRILGYVYYNAAVKQFVIKYCSECGIDIEEQISSWRARKIFCKNCGKEITGKDRFKKDFCSQSCAVSYTNRLRPPKSIEEREKISRSLQEYYKHGGKHSKGGNMKLLSDCIKEGIILNPYDTKIKDKYVSELKLKEKTCVICGKSFKPFLNKNGNLYKGDTCSEECSHKLKSNISVELQERLIKEGKHNGWTSRKVTSYPEKFWEGVLSGHNIKYIREYHFDKKYFLDFYIETQNGIIDLEIDGKQHQYPDRKKSDSIRDEYIKSKGLVVYRIPWNSINNENGKALMKTKIDKFLSFYKEQQ